jgi:peptidoglycan-N-acetylglucosamine deacetylase
MWGLAAALGVGSAAGIAAYGAVGRSSQLFGPYVNKGAGTHRSVALTFDDGPSEGTLALLDYLAEQSVVATFFQCGMNVQRLPSVARRVLEGGHEIGNHTRSHPLLPLKSASFIDREFSQAQAIIEHEVGVVPVLLRPPFGVRWIGMRAVQKKLRLLGVGWTVIGYDWVWPADRIAAHVLKKSSAGGIIVLHDGRELRVNPDISPTLKAAQQIVPRLKEEGYRFETVSQLLQSDDKLQS